MRIVTIPASLDDKTLDVLAGGIGDWPPGEALLFDARAAQWASPYGLTAMLTLGQAIAEAKLPAPRLTIPEKEDVKSYWSRAGFFQAAAECFELVGKIPKRTADPPSDVLLPVTPSRAAEDVMHVVGRIQERAQRILASELNLAPKATVGFAMALSEACQNVVEHAGTGGWVAVQTYNWRRRLGRKVVVIAVSDSGIGFRRSLEATEAKKVGDRWGDGAALELALLQNISRFRDPGRGQGLAGIRRYLGRWQGKISVRSGTARLAVVPSWDDDEPLAEFLPFFPGSQVQITIPAQEAGAP
ncbi:MAG TPA: ATP-binding protein [Gemmatimonadales bacterium]|nr:ATP-binding protein [Gemmatimonadales bacterium]